ncbi:hypothetical protein H6G89_23100 [Oscillatoria sp. FACHB-1407]|uniref:hypothetical protein n=1 Tax=Oscillatoria sp. FACHB-1407 TaxID=2692847 RepID=UPI001688389A|nr:hypothetical protein [Oscillatoria sp. FACHB-1407]MBD2463893.1 hypothetical protein [Oscillatoria sp. FACHB-1407]
MALTTQLITVEVNLDPSPVRLQQAIATALQQQGEPLRWAITAIDSERSKAHIEAVITVEAPTAAFSVPTLTV